MLRVLFVCTGNTCRSPMAEAIAREKLAGHPDVSVASAGLASAGGSAASQHAAFVVHDRGGDLSGHVSRSLDDDSMDAADLILTMTAAHRDAARARWPQRSADIRILGEYGEAPAADVNDPFGGTLEEYERAYDQIAALVEAALPDILRESGQSDD